MYCNPKLLGCSSLLLFVIDFLLLVCNMLITRNPASSHPRSENLQRFIEFSDYHTSQDIEVMKNDIDPEVLGDGSRTWRKFIPGLRISALAPRLIEFTSCLEFERRFLFSLVDSFSLHKTHLDYSNILQASLASHVSNVDLSRRNCWISIFQQNTFRQLWIRSQVLCGFEKLVSVKDLDSVFHADINAVVRILNVQNACTCFLMLSSFAMQWSHMKKIPKSEKFRVRWATTRCWHFRST